MTHIGLVPSGGYDLSLKHILNWRNEMAMISDCDTSWYGATEGQAMSSDCDTSWYGATEGQAMSADCDTSWYGATEG